MALLWAALMPHPPVILPEIGNGREKEAALTLQGLSALQGKVRACTAAPEAIIALSPHQPYVAGALFVNTARQQSGTFSRFGAPGLAVGWETPAPLLQKFADRLTASALPARYAEVPDITSDHGSMVPLRLLSSACTGGVLPPVILANPSGLSPEQALLLGQVVAGLAQEHDIAFLASGDLSHRLKQDGPYGFNPAGPVFDKAVQDALNAGDASILLDLDQRIREDAAECGLRPVLALLGLCRAPVPVLSYEGPFGVGYCTAFAAPGQ